MTDGIEVVPSLAIAKGEVCLYSSPSPFRIGANEDAVGVFACGLESAIVVVADGLGGMRAGDVASRVAVEQVGRRVGSLATQFGLVPTRVDPLSAISGHRESVSANSGTSKANTSGTSPLPGNASIPARSVESRRITCEPLAQGQSSNRPVNDEVPADVQSPRSTEDLEQNPETHAANVRPVSLRAPTEQGALTADCQLEGNPALELSIPSGVALPTGMLRAAVLDGIERANDTIQALGIGAATTIAAAEITGREVRPYHVGDSMILLVGQRGKVKFQSVSHSPVAQAVEAGLLDEHEAMHHEDRHLVSNVVGSPSMRIEIGPQLKMAERDTLLLASDGLFDNLHLSEIIEIVRKGPLRECVRGLAAAATQRMHSESTKIPSKPDDLSIVAFRRRPKRRRRTKKSASS